MQCGHSYWEEVFAGRLRQSVSFMQRLSALTAARTWHNWEPGDRLQTWYVKGQKSSKNLTLDRLAAALGPIRYEGLTQHLVRRLRDCNLEGVIQPGDRLPAK